MTHTGVELHNLPLVRGTPDVLELPRSPLQLLWLQRVISRPAHITVDTFIVATMKILNQITIILMNALFMPAMHGLT